MISSRDNNHIKLIRRLMDKAKYRREENRFIIEGIKPVEEALKRGLVEEIYLAEGVSVPVDFPVTDTVSGLLFKEISDTVTPQGILAVVSKTPAAQPDVPKGSNILILDKLQDPGNLGTIIRTADAAGYGAIIAVKGTGDIYSPKVARAAAGSLFRVPVTYADTEADALDLARSWGKKVFCTSFDTDIMYYDANLSRDAAIVIGNEGNGVSETFIREADELIKIPMRGSIDSLNAAVAAAVIMYHSVLQQKRQ